MQHVNRARRELPFVSSVGESARLFPLETQSASIQLLNGSLARYWILEWEEMLRVHLACVHMHIWEARFCVYTRTHVAYPPLSHTAGGSVNDEVWHMYRIGRSIMLGHVTRTPVSVALRISLAAIYSYAYIAYIYVCMYVHTRDLLFHFTHNNILEK